MSNLVIERGTGANSHRITITKGARTTQVSIETLQDLRSVHNIDALECLIYLAIDELNGGPGCLADGQTGESLTQDEEKTVRAVVSEAMRDQ